MAIKIAPRDLLSKMDFTISGKMDMLPSIFNVLWIFLANRKEMSAIFPEAEATLSCPHCVVKLEEMADIIRQLLEKAETHAKEMSTN